MGWGGFPNPPGGVKEGTSGLGNPLHRFLLSTTDLPEAPASGSPPEASLTLRASINGRRCQAVSHACVNRGKSAGEAGFPSVLLRNLHLGAGFAMME